MALLQAIVEHSQLVAGLGRSRSAGQVTACRHFKARGYTYCGRRRFPRRAFAGRDIAATQPRNPKASPAIG